MQMLFLLLSLALGICNAGRGSRDSSDSSDDNPSSAGNFTALGDELSCGFVTTPNNADFDQYAHPPLSVSIFDSVKIPSAVVMCGCEQDVMTAMNWLTENGKPFEVRSGAHSFGVFSKEDGSAIIDLSQMTHIYRTTTGNRVSIEAGADFQHYEEWKAANPSFTRTFPHAFQFRT